MTSYLLYNDIAELPEVVNLKDICINSRKLKEEELQLFSSRYKYGYQATTVFAECKGLIPLLTQEFLKNGGKVKQRKVENLDDILRDYNVVFNCTGINSLTLANDEKVYPVRGQVHHIDAQWIKNGLIAGESYILPTTSCITLGGTRQKGSWDLNVKDDDKKSILESCSKLVPSIKFARTVGEWVGIRPGREAPRVELERKVVDGKTRYIIHNYGHGGSGVTLFWGSANTAVDMISSCLNYYKNIKSKL